MHTDTAHRGHLLYVALGFLGLDVPPRKLSSWMRQSASEICESPS